jgi:hypothetical protein
MLGGGVLSIQQEDVMGREERRHTEPPRGGESSDSSASGMAWAALVLGVLSWVPLPVVAAIAGAIIGWVELGRIEEGTSPAGGETIARIGFWLSVANLAVSIFVASLGVLLWFAFGVAILALLGLA